MSSFISQKWIDEKIGKLKSKGLKIGRPRRFRDSNIIVQASILNIAENISSIVGFDNVTVEPSLTSGNADIRFIDEDVYYLEVKSSLFFESKPGDKFADVSNEFNRLFLRSKSRFAVGYATDSSRYLVHAKNIQKQGRRVSLGILAYDASIAPTRDVKRKLLENLFRSNKQLGKIREKSQKIFILDISHYPIRGNWDFYELLKGVFCENHTDLSALDGIGLFSWNPAYVIGDTMSATIIPVYLKEEVTSKVFQQPYQLRNGKMWTIQSSMEIPRTGWNDFFKIDRTGFISVDDVEYGHFWKYINFLSALNKVR